MHLLTIAVPIFNDANGLKITLENLEANLIGLENKVQVLVSDNFSTDESLRVARGFSKKIANFSVLAQSKNLGFARNLQALCGAADCDYIWFIGAGEQIVPEAFRDLIEMLESRHFSWGTVGGIIVSDGFETFEPSTYPKESQSPKFRFADAGELNDLEVFNHLISLNIFRKSTFEALSLSPGKEADYWPHFEAVRQYALKAKTRGLKFCWFNFDLLAVVSPGNPETGSWDGSSEALHIFHEWRNVCSDTSASLPNSIWLKRKVKALSGEHLARFVFMIKKHRVMTRREVTRELKKMALSPTWRFITQAINYTPNIVLIGMSKARTQLAKLTPPKALDWFHHR